MHAKTVEQLEWVGIELRCAGVIDTVGTAFCFYPDMTGSILFYRSDGLVEYFMQLGDRTLGETGLHLMPIVAIQTLVGAYP